LILNKIALCDIAGGDSDSGGLALLKNLNSPLFVDSSIISIRQEKLLISSGKQRLMDYIPFDFSISFN
jgi:hypothetical protein